MPDKFKRNDVVRCINRDSHWYSDRLMVVDRYHVNSEAVTEKGKRKRILLTEGGYYKEGDLELVYRPEKVTVTIDKYSLLHGCTETYTFESELEKAAFIKGINEGTEGFGCYEIINKKEDCRDEKR